MKKKIFFALMVTVVLMAISAVTYHRASAVFTPNHHTRLLFPFVTNANGFDTGISISNTSVDPFGTPQESGACTLYFYGSTATTPSPSPVTTDTIAAGMGYATLLSIIAPGFTGYVIASCDFRNAHGWAMMSDVGARTLATSVPALVMTVPRPLLESLGE